MNQRKAKLLRRIAKSRVTSITEPVIRFFVYKQKGGAIKDSLVPMPLEWAAGTYRRIYQDLK